MNNNNLKYYKAERMSDKYFNSISLDNFVEDDILFKNDSDNYQLKLDEKYQDLFKHESFIKSLTDVGYVDLDIQEFKDDIKKLNYKDFQQKYFMMVISYNVAGSIKSYMAESFIKESIYFMGLFHDNRNIKATALGNDLTLKFKNLSSIEDKVLTYDNEEFKLKIESIKILPQTNKLMQFIRKLNGLNNNYNLNLNLNSFYLSWNVGNGKLFSLVIDNSEDVINLMKELNINWFVINNKHHKGATAIGLKDDKYVELTDDLDNKVRGKTFNQMSKLKVKIQIPLFFKHSYGFTLSTKNNIKNLKKLMTTKGFNSYTSDVKYSDFYNGRIPYLYDFTHRLSSVLYFNGLFFNETDNSLILTDKFCDGFNYVNLKDNVIFHHSYKIRDFKFSDKKHLFYNDIPYYSLINNLRYNKNSIGFKGNENVFYSKSLNIADEDLYKPFYS